MCMPIFGEDLRSIMEISTREKCNPFLLNSRPHPNLKKYKTLPVNVSARNSKGVEYGVRSVSVSNVSYKSRKN